MLIEVMIIINKVAKSKITRNDVYNAINKVAKSRYQVNIIIGSVDSQYYMLTKKLNINQQRKEREVRIE